MLLSVLDQSPIPEGKNAVEALADTTRFAQETEKMGYHRFWVSEHHFTQSLAGSSPGSFDQPFGGQNFPHADRFRRRDASALQPV